MTRRREAGTYACPHCGEPNDTCPDPGGDSFQDYIEDCTVCCKPIRITASRIEGESEFIVEASAEV